MPIRLGAGASGAGADFACTGAFPPLTTRAGVAGSSSATAFSAAAGLAGADETPADFAALADGLDTGLPAEASVSFDEFAELPMVMSGCKTGAGFVGSAAAEFDCALSGFGAAEGAAEVEVATGWGAEPLAPLKWDHPK